LHKGYNKDDDDNDNHDYDYDGDGDGGGGVGGGGGGGDDDDDEDDDDGNQAFKTHNNKFTVIIPPHAHNGTYNTTTKLMANTPALQTLHSDTWKSKKREVIMRQHQIRFLYRVSSTFIWL
jgi:hypothetical protein